MAQRWVCMGWVVALCLGLSACAQGEEREDELQLTDPVYPACNRDADCAEGGHCVTDGRTLEDGEEGSAYSQRYSTCAYDCQSDADCPGERGFCVETYGTPRCVLAGVGFSCYTWSEKKDCTHNAPSGTEGADDGGSDDGGQGSNCGSWDPDALVAYSRTTRKYEVDQQLIDDLEADRTLLDCDAARARLVSGGYYELHSVGRDDLSSHLGLRSGDIIKSVNGYDLLNEADYLAAYAALDGTTTEFELEVDRGGRIITIKYVIV